MAITKYPPNLIRLSGGGPIDNEHAAGAAITPGMLIEGYGSAGSFLYRPHSSATTTAPLCVALEQVEMNLTVNDPYAINDLVKAWYMPIGATFWGIVQSGENIAVGDPVQSAGNGKLKEATSATAAAGVAKFQALEGIGAVVADTRCRMQVVSA